MKNEGVIVKSIGNIEFKKEKIPMDTLNHDTSAKRVMFLVDETYIQ